MKNKYKRRRIILIVVIAMILFSFSASFGRYVVINIHDMYLRARKFYFQSDKLSITGKTFKIDNWPGLVAYPINVEINSRKNYLEATDYDIPYTIRVTNYSSQYISYSLDKNSGIVDAGDNSDSFNLTIHPIGTLAVGTLVYIEVEAKTTNPYAKTIKGRFELEVGKEEITFEIKDEPGAPFMLLNITNTISSGTSAINLNFNPNYILLDLTDSNYLHRTSMNTTNMGGYNYINNLGFNLNSESSSSVRFYKQDVTQDYSGASLTINNNNDYIFRVGGTNLITCSGTRN